jgi:hypothetical protein
MNVFSVLCTASCLLAASAAHPQSESKSDKYLLIEREMLKPGKSGAHARTEQAWTRAYQQAKSREYYTGLSSLTGPDRALFLIPFASLAEWQSKMDEIGPSSQTLIDKANEADGENLSSSEMALFEIRPDLSTNTNGPALGTRYMEIVAWLIKPGHEQEWEEAAKRYIKLAGNHPEVHWTAYDMAFGSQEAGEKNAAYFSELFRNAVVWTHDNLFRVDPKLSFPSPEMISSDPKFWKPAAASAAPAKKPE